MRGRLYSLAIDLGNTISRNLVFVYDVRSYIQFKDQVIESPPLVGLHARGAANTGTTLNVTA